MICSLCLLEKDLIKKSHIIPDFMYKGLFDQKHKILYGSIQQNKKKQLSDGIYDKYILCNKCDNEVLGKLETYASIMIYGGYPGKVNLPIFKKSKGKDGIDALEISNIDYNKMKLFLLSLLWRAHISIHPFFKQVSLGPHAEKIRKLIMENDGGSEDAYETVVAIFRNTTSELPFTIIGEPRKLKQNQNTIYTFFINSCMYYFNISPVDKTNMFSKGRINKNNTMKILILEGNIAEEHFKLYLGAKVPLKNT